MDLIRKILSNRQFRHLRNSRKTPKNQIQHQRHQRNVAIHLCRPPQPKKGLCFICSYIVHMIVIMLFARRKSTKRKTVLAVFSNTTTTRSMTSTSTTNSNQDKNVETSLPSSPITITNKDNQIKKVFNQISGGGIAKDLLSKSGIVRNTKRMRFQTKTITLFADE